MRTLLLIHILICISEIAYCSKEIPDSIIFNKDKLALLTFPLDSCEKVQFPSRFSGCHRGYSAIWTIKNDSLFLVSIRNCYYGVEGLKEKPIIYPLNMFFDNVRHDGTVYAGWYSGILSIEKETNFPNKFFAKKRLHIGIESGKTIGLGEHLFSDFSAYRGYKTIGAKSFRFGVSNDLNYEEFYSGYLSDTLKLISENKDVRLKAHFFKTKNNYQIKDSFFDSYINSYVSDKYKISKVNRKGNLTWVHCKSKKNAYSVQVYSKGGKYVLIEIWMEGVVKANLNRYTEAFSKTIEFNE